MVESNEISAMHRVPLLSVKDLIVGYDKGPILEVSELNALGAEVIGIVGASGVGKSTLLKCLAGNLKQLNGTHRLDTNDISRLNAHTDRSLTLQSFPLLHWLTVRENLQLAAKIKKVSVKDFDEILNNFSALEIANRFPETLSGGERCRASISQALIGDPALLLMDEPYSGLDIVVKEAIARRIGVWVKKTKSVAIFVTHDVFDAVEYSNRVIVVGGGTPARIVAVIPSDNKSALAKVRQAILDAS